MKERILNIIYHTLFFLFVMLGGFGLATLDWKP